MSEEKKSIKDQAEDIRKELDELIGESVDITEVTETDPAFLPHQPKEILPTFGELKVKSTATAKKTITALMKFYLAEDIIEKDEYGELAPRMFEVLATLQKSMLDIIKSQTMYLMATEESAKRISRDIEIYKKRDDVREIEESGGSTGDSAVQRGTKDLMRMIRSGIDSETQDIEDVEPNEE